MTLGIFADIHFIIFIRKLMILDLTLGLKIARFRLTVN